jgi:hypothetical protein
MSFKGFRRSQTKGSVAASIVLVVILAGAGLLAVVASVGMTSAGSKPAASPAGSGDPLSVMAGPPAPITLGVPGADSITGISVAVSGSTVAVGAPGYVSSGIANAGAVLVTNPSVGGSVLIPNPAPQSYADFGVSVSISGTTLAVGAPGENVTGLDSDGAVFLFDLTNDKLITQLNNPTPQRQAEFGWSVSLGGTTLVVGVPDQNASGFEYAGAADVFSTTTGLSSTLTSPNPIEDGGFGLSVAVSGSIVVVGAPGESASGLAHAGNAYQFSAYTGHLIRILTSGDPTSGTSTFLLIGNATAGGGFGASVAVSGSSIVVGAPGEEGPGGPGPIGSGNAYLFSAFNASRITLSPPTRTFEGFFGSSVSVSGKTVVVGAENMSTDTVANSGTAYAFSTTLVSELTSNFASPGEQSGGLFGLSVAVSGTIFVVGAPVENDQAGHAYVFRAPPVELSGALSLGYSVAVNGTSVVTGAPYYDSYMGLVWITNKQTGARVVLQDPGAQTYSYFGFSVAISGGTILVGAPLQQFDSVGTGAAFAFNATTGNLERAYYGSTSAPGAFFGFSVALSGTTAGVGTPLLPGGGNVTTYDIASSSTTPVRVFTSPNPSLYGFFGYALAIRGTEAIVGAPNETATIGETSLASAGHAYLIDLSTNAITTLNSESPLAGELFGYSVGIDSSTAIVGAPNETVGSTASAGSAYLFDVASGHLTDTLNSSSPTFEGRFGTSVAIGGITAVVGAPGETSYSVGCGLVSDAGVVYLFNTQNHRAVDVFSSPNAVFGGELGDSVTLGSSFVVTGAPGEDEGDGAVYVI